MEIYKFLIFFIIQICRVRSYQVNPDNGYQNRTFKSRNFELPSRVIGGELAEKGQLPYQLSLQRHGQHFCGAVLVTSPAILPFTGSIALTAGHCVGNDDLSGLTVMGGTVELNDNNENTTSQILGVRKIVRHENYDFPRNDNDIAILFLSGVFTITENLAPVSLPTQDEIFDTRLRISGWGNINVTSPTYPNHLQFADVPVVSNVKCAKQYENVYGDEEVIFDSNICAGYDNGGKDTCQGDSGGPAVGGIDNVKVVLYGLTSWGEGCAEAGFPGVYVRVASYVTWIEHRVANEYHNINFKSAAFPTKK